MELSTKQNEVPYAELVAKTNYSFLEGASHPEEMVAMAQKLGYSALGIVDKNGVYGAPRAHIACKSASLKLLIGAEITLEECEAPLFLLAKNRTGYGNLCELLTSIHAKENLALSLTELLEKGSDLFALLPAWNIEKAPLLDLKNYFKENFYLLVSRFMDGADLLFLRSAEFYSAKYEIPCVASNQPLFHTPQRKPLQDTLTCIRHTCTLKTAGFRLLPNAERVMKTRKNMLALFKDHPEWLRNTITISDACHFSLDEIKYHYPTEWIPEGETGDSYLAKLTWEGANRRYNGDPPLAVREQITKELQLIRDLKYSDYFLTIWDIVGFAKSQKILYQGRGSAANSVVCYVLEITAIDPIRMDLLFERFISQERKEPPDIDIDFEHERREEVIQYIYQRYGRARAAITAEVICYRRRSALREVAKVFEIPLSMVESLLVHTHRKDLRDISIEELLKLDPTGNAPLLKQYFGLVQELLSFPRHLGTHVGGFVLCHDLLTRNVPIEKAAMPGRTIVQWDKNDLDALGFVRVDILGLGILTCIRKAFEGVKALHGKEFTLANIPAEDPKVYNSFCQGDTVGVFQIESRAQMNMLPRLKPRNFFDLVVEISIVRPGPIQGEMVHPYLRRRAGKEPIQYAHPELEAILKKTYGVPLFQEQIMKMAMKVAGFSGGEADELRRAMGSWRRLGKNRLTRMGEKFCQGLLAKGISRPFAEQIFSQIEGFAEYGFPESHAASFSILAYVSAYLRLYYPDIFLTAILNAQPMGFYQPSTLIHDAERHGVTVLGIDINRSDWDNRLEEKNHVRLGYREVYGLNKNTGLTVEKLRSQNPFPSLLDFVDRLKEALHPKCLTKRELFLLAGANSFESVGLNRREAWWEIQALPLQDSQILPTLEPPTMLPREKKWESILLDYEAQGVSLFAHPLQYFRSALQAKGALSSQAFRTPTSRFLKTKRKVTVGGLVISRQMPPTASGVLFITLEDEFGFMNLVIWRKVYEAYREILITQSFLYCEGFVEKPEDAEVFHIIVEKVGVLLNGKALRLESHDFH